MYQFEDLFDVRSVAGARLEALLGERGLTKARVCSESKVSRPTLDKILAGSLSSKTNYEKHMKKVLEYLGITPDVLMGNIQNAFNRSRILRSVLNIQPEALSSATSIPQERLREIEAGAEPTVAELRDIAVCLSTSTRSVLGTNYFDTQLAVLQYFLAAHEDDVAEGSGFWGHIGIRLPVIDRYKWFPITRNTRRAICRGMQNQRLVIPCMNNRVLFLNLKNVSDIILLDEACDPPEDCDWDTGVNCGEIPLVAYEVLDDYLYYTDTGRELPADSFSPKLATAMAAIIEKELIREEDIRTAYAYYADGSKAFLDVEFHGEETITGAISDIYEFGDSAVEERFLYYQDRDEADHFLNMEQVAMLELPLVEVEDAICRSMEEMMAENENR